MDLVKSACGAAAAHLIQYGVPATSNPDSVFLDPVTVGAMLVKANIRPCGKMTIWSTHKITFDRDHGYCFQGIKRTMTNIMYPTGGATAKALHNLATPLYYLVMRLDPHKHPANRLFALLIWRGAMQLADTYAPTYNETGSVKKTGDICTVQYIQGILCKIIGKAMRGKAIDPINTYRPYCWDHNPLLYTCDKFWSEKGQFKTLQAHVINALVPMLEGQVDKSDEHLKKALEITEQVRPKITVLARQLSQSGEGAPSSEEIAGLKYEESDLKDQLSENELHTLRNRLWGWLKEMGDKVSPTSWEKQLGIPTGEQRWRNDPPEKFWQWLGLPLPKGLEQNAAKE